MPNLVCNVMTCGYNQGRFCSLPEINVSGGNTKENTVCQSFVQAVGAYNCALGFPITVVNCGAQDCIHNSKCRCNAADIDICCDKEARACRDTMCGSYKHY
ncbi:MAG: DUF1540 domain-containing protein [Oscillospiraceae bacterium]|nr:DUF1540 domain-containing protein [Oscillospiraceae bacterium]